MGEGAEGSTRLVAGGLEVCSDGQRTCFIDGPSSAELLARRWLLILQAGRERTFGTGLPEDEFIVYVFIALLETLSEVSEVRLAPGSRLEFVFCDMYSG